MFNVVKIGDKDVPMLSAASVDLYYSAVFHEDPLKVQTNATDYSEAIGFYYRMGFIMAKFAEVKSRKGMQEITSDDYAEWLDQFDRRDLMEALEAIQGTYDGQSVTYADAKKNTDEPSDK